MDLFIVTFAPDIWWLEQCLRSVAKFCTGFGPTHVAFPRHEELHFETLADELAVRGVGGDGSIRWHAYDEASPPLAHLDHNIRKCTADLFCPEADLFCHVDSDCLFREPTTPATYLVEGKPVLLMEAFHRLKTEHPGRYFWKSTVDAAFKMDCAFEFMCRHPAVHWREMYSFMRERVEQVHGKSFVDYVLSCKPDRPCTFAEFPALGAYAYYSKHFGPRYHFIDVTGDPSKRPHDHLLQFWSRQSPEKEQDIWIEGVLHHIVPATVIKGLLE